MKRCWNVHDGACRRTAVSPAYPALCTCNAFSWTFTQEAILLVHPVDVHVSFQYKATAGKGMYPVDHVSSGCTRTTTAYDSQTHMVMKVCWTCKEILASILPPHHTCISLMTFHKCLNRASESWTGTCVCYFKTNASRFKLSLSVKTDSYESSDLLEAITNLMFEWICTCYISFAKGKWSQVALHTS